MPHCFRVALTLACALAAAACTLPACTLAMPSSYDLEMSIKTSLQGRIAKTSVSGVDGAVPEGLAEQLDGISQDPGSNPPQEYNYGLVLSVGQLAGAPAGKLKLDLSDLKQKRRDDMQKLFEGGDFPMMTGTMSMPGMEGQPGITEDQKAKLRAAMEQGIEAMPDHLVFQITCENPDKPMTSLVAYPDEDNCTVLSSATAENDTVSSLLDSQTNASDASEDALVSNPLPISTFLADVVCKQRTPFQAWESECASWNFVSDNNTYVGANCLGHDGSVASSMNGSGVRELDASVTSTIVVEKEDAEVPKVASIVQMLDNEVNITLTDEKNATAPGGVGGVSMEPGPVVGGSSMPEMPSGQEDANGLGRRLAQAEDGDEGEEEGEDEEDEEEMAEDPLAGGAASPLPTLTITTVLSSTYTGDFTFGDVREIPANDVEREIAACPSR